jgi:hypothetical protein
MIIGSLAGGFHVAAAAGLLDKFEHAASGPTNGDITDAADRRLATG